MKAFKGVTFEVFLVTIVLSGMLTFGYAGFSLYSRARNITRTAEVADVYSPEGGGSVVAG